MYAWPSRYKHATWHREETLCSSIERRILHHAEVGKSPSNVSELLIRLWLSQLQASNTAPPASQWEWGRLDWVIGRKIQASSYLEVGVVHTVEYGVSWISWQHISTLWLLRTLRDNWEVPSALKTHRSANTYRRLQCMRRSKCLAQVVVISIATCCIQLPWKMLKVLFM